MDIGEASVIRTIFGTPRVRVTRGQDRKRRALLIASLGLVSISVASWHVWTSSQQTMRIAQTVPLGERVHVSEPVSMPQAIPTYVRSLHTAAMPDKLRRAIIEEKAAVAKGTKHAQPAVAGAPNIITKPTSSRTLIAKRQRTNTSPPSRPGDSLEHTDSGPQLLSTGTSGGTESSDAALTRAAAPAATEDTVAVWPRAVSVDTSNGPDAIENPRASTGKSSS
jgi:hypothetical protein